MRQRQLADLHFVPGHIYDLTMRQHTRSVLKFLLSIHYPCTYVDMMVVNHSSVHLKERYA